MDEQKQPRLKPEDQYLADYQEGQDDCRLGRNRKHPRDTSKWYQMGWMTYYHDTSKLIAEQAQGRGNGLIGPERSVMDSLISAFNHFCDLETTHPDEEMDFRRAIHAAQSVLAMRVVRRDRPSGWPTHSMTIRERHVRLHVVCEDAHADIDSIDELTEHTINIIKARNHPTYHDVIIRDHPILKRVRESDEL